jgi:hypothetical protein
VRTFWLFLISGIFWKDRAVDENGISDGVSSFAGYLGNE